MTERLYWQGSHDSFCGLYAAADIIVRHQTAQGLGTDVESRFNRAFYSLVQSAEELGLMTAQRIAGGADGGFTSPLLGDIINGLPAKNRAGLLAVAFADPEFERLGDAERKALLMQGACFIADHDGGKHWVAVVGKHRDGGYFCFDPDRSANVTRRQRIRWSDGVLLTPPELLAETNG